MLKQIYNGYFQFEVTLLIVFQNKFDGKVFKLHSRMHGVHQNLKFGLTSIFYSFNNV